MLNFPTNKQSYKMEKHQIGSKVDYQFIIHISIERWLSTSVNPLFLAVLYMPVTHSDLDVPFFSSYEEAPVKKRH